MHKTIRPIPLDAISETSFAKARSLNLAVRVTSPVTFVVPSATDKLVSYVVRIDDSEELPTFDCPCGAYASCHHAARAADIFHQLAALGVTIDTESEAAADDVNPTRHSPAVLSRAVDCVNEVASRVMQGYLDDDERDQIARLLCSTSSSLTGLVAPAERLVA